MKGYCDRKLGNEPKWVVETGEGGLKYEPNPKYGQPLAEEQKPTEDWREKRKKECPFRKTLDNNLFGCEKYAGAISICDGRCSWVVDYPKLKEIQDKQEPKPLPPFDEMSPEERMNHPLYLEGFNIGKSVGEALKGREKRVADSSKTSAGWSEKDEEIRAKLLSYFIGFTESTSFGRQEVLDIRLWLKHLRSHWKPSKEQMNRLVSIIAALRKDDCDDMADFLASLYHNLEKLI